MQVCAAKQPPPPPPKEQSNASKAHDRYTSGGRAFEEQRLLPLHEEWEERQVELPRNETRTTEKAMGRVKFKHSHSQCGFCRLERRPTNRSSMDQVLAQQNHKPLKTLQQSLQYCAASAPPSEPPGLSKPRSLNTLATTFKVWAILMA